MTSCSLGPHDQEDRNIIFIFAKGSGLAWDDGTGIKAHFRPVDPAHLPPPGRPSGHGWIPASLCASGPREICVQVPSIVSPKQGGRKIQLSPQRGKACCLPAGISASRYQIHTLGDAERFPVVCSSYGMTSRCGHTKKQGNGCKSWTFHVTLGRLFFQDIRNPLLTPQTEIQDIKQPFRLLYSEEKPQKRALFSS